MIRDDEFERIETPDLRDIHVPYWQDNDLMPDSGDPPPDPTPRWTEEIVEKRKQGLWPLF